MRLGEAKAIPEDDWRRLFLPGCSRTGEDGGTVDSTGEVGPVPGEDKAGLDAVQPFERLERLERVFVVVR